MEALLLVFFGGGWGSVSRYLISRWLRSSLGDLWGWAWLPWGTLSVNVLGCLILGIVMGLTQGTSSSRLALLWGTGFCGGFTTFSTWMYENHNLIYTLQPLGSTSPWPLVAMGLYLGLSVGLGFLAMAMGLTWAATR